MAGQIDKPTIADMKRYRAGQGNAVRPCDLGTGQVQPVQDLGHPRLDQRGRDPLAPDLAPVPADPTLLQALRDIVAVALAAPPPCRSR